MACWLIRAARAGSAAGSACGGSGGSIPPSRSSRPISTASSSARSGSPAASALYLIRDGRREALPSKVTNVMLRKGDIVRLETSGGGGFGEPKMRLAEQVERDVRLGYVSPEAAASCYGQRRAGTAE
jgi:N-methylhydantoinase B/oxoprolinase/acetone carboxylase alpha subunit